MTNVYELRNASGNTLNYWTVVGMLKDSGISGEAISKGTSAVEKDAERKGVNLNQFTFIALQQGKVEEKTNGNKQKGRDMDLAALGIPMEVVAQGEQAVQAYAAQNGITLPHNNSQLNLVA
jgi:hypothetical protein